MRCIIDRLKAIISTFFLIQRQDTFKNVLFSLPNAISVSFCVCFFSALIRVILILKAGNKLQQTSVAGELHDFSREGKVLLQLILSTFRLGDEYQTECGYDFLNLDRML